jgi:arylamine N-acetyltransferase
MDLPPCLDRTEYTLSPLQRNDHTLVELLEKHVLTVPFENPDIMRLPRPIRLEEKSPVDKPIIGR